MQLQRGHWAAAGQSRSQAERPKPPPETHKLRPETHNSDPQNTEPAFSPPPPLRHIAEGSFFVGDDRIIRQMEDGQAEPVTYGGTCSNRAAP